MEFLADYGQADRRYEKIAKLAGYALLAAVVAGGLYWLLFRNWREERQISTFLTLLEQQKYEDGYRMWGCSTETPCPNYSYNKFLEDWGPNSAIGNVSNFHVGRSYDQPSGVIILVEVNGHKIANLWVGRGSEVIGFSPY
jgi:hypothetical protein